MFYYPDPLAKLISELQKLPSIGPKTAQRIAMHILRMKDEDAKRLGQVISDVKDQIIYCSLCGGVTDRDPCHICSDQRRDHKMICVVEETDDIMALEKAGIFKGVYHVLMGALSPMEGINPDDLRIKELFERINSQEIAEVLIATNPNSQGQATAIYLSKKIKPMGIRVTQLAYGLPIGGDIEYADEVTLGKALEGRREI
ncbi:MAG: Recombination protein RecR [Candidatus Poribacteria bacterium]|nr:Recombination protein RecR [Candidatus Poribacteria bacterium]MDQ1329292.1 Recombination protein RecR [Candidatus Poribacteria bacterium]